MGREGEAKGNKRKGREGKGREGMAPRRPQAGHRSAPRPPTWPRGGPRRPLNRPKKDPTKPPRTRCRHDACTRATRPPRTYRFGALLGPQKGPPRGPPEASSAYCNPSWPPGLHRVRLGGHWPALSVPVVGLVGASRGACEGQKCAKHGVKWTFSLN